MPLLLVVANLSFDLFAPRAPQRRSLHKVVVRNPLRCDKENQLQPNEEQYHANIKNLKFGTACCTLTLGVMLAVSTCINWSRSSPEKQDNHLPRIGLSLAFILPSVKILMNSNKNNVL